ncbi:MAG: cell envelope biogenesis protein OmpA, partial [Gammaproteobacteria bacterium]|nr:cell envelope biogenesis protein OmpA [Gammaproteobacteria bacterium]
IPQRLSTVGVGSSHPVADNETAEGRALNRRVEITLVPLRA